MQSSHYKISSSKNAGIFRNNDQLFYLQDVGVEFGRFRVLESIELSIERGEILFITGPSGAGKTTMLRVLGGELTPTTGKALLPNRLGSQGLFVAQVFQELRLVGRDSCKDNLLTAYDPAIYSSRSNFLSDMNQLCNILGITDRLCLKAREANGGLRQKIAVVRALLAKPDIFIADEPTSSLDAENAKRVFDLLNFYNVKRGLTIIWASHNADLVHKFSGRIVHLNRGRLVHSGHACFI